MNNSIESSIPEESKVIVGVDRSQATGWFSLHLHDALYAVSIRLDERRVVIDEGRGPGRLQETIIPFENILRFETFRYPIGSDCVPETSSGSIGEGRVKLQLFSPVAVRLLIKHSTNIDLISTHDI